MKGYVDNFRGNIVEGWAFSGSLERCVIEVVSGQGAVLNVGVADIFRKDVFEAGYGDGFHGFRIALSDEALLEECLYVRDLASGEELNGSRLFNSAGATRSDFVGHLDIVKDWLRLGDSRRKVLSNIYNGIKQLEGDIFVDNGNIAQGPHGRLDIVIFPPIDWGYREQRPQHLARALADSGCRVAYVSTDFLVPVDARPTAEILKIPHPNVIHVKLSRAGRHDPINLELFLDAEIEHLSSSLMYCLRMIGFIRPTLIVGAPTWWGLAKTIRSPVLYDCMDMYSHFSFARSALVQAEKELTKECSAVITTSDPLYQDLIKRNSKVDVIKNATTEDLFSIVRTSSTEKIIGYIGAVEDWFDEDLLIGAATLLAGAQFHIYGNIGVERIKQRFAGISNIVTHGEVPRSKIAGILSTFSVGIIPFRDIPLIRHTNPVKCYEYLAAGLPVVSSPMPEVRDFHPHVIVAETAETFAAAILKQLDQSTQDEQISSRRRSVRNHTWGERASRVLGTIASVYYKVTVLLVVEANDKISSILSLLDMLRSCAATRILVEKGSPAHRSIETMKTMGLANDADIYPVQQGQEIDLEGEHLVIWSNEFSINELFNSLNSDRRRGPGWIRANFDRSGPAGVVICPAGDGLSLLKKRLLGLSESSDGDRGS